MPPKPAPKLTKKELQAQKEEEKRKQEEEEKRLKEIEEAKKAEQERKLREEQERLAEEERQRLKSEEPEIQLQNQQIMQARAVSEKNLKLEENWQKYLKCNKKPDPVLESDLTCYITQYKQYPQVTTMETVDTGLQKIQQSEDLIDDIMTVYCRSVAENKPKEEIMKYQEYINDIRSITQQKLEEISALICIKAEELHEQKQEELKKKEGNDTSSKIIKGGDDKQKAEIYKIYTPLKDFRFGMWINPTSKSGYRHRPNEFKDEKYDLLISCSVPKTLMAQALIMKALWRSEDCLTDKRIYTKDLIMGGVLDVECYDYLTPKKQGNNWALRQEFNVKEIQLKRIPYPADQTTNAYTNVQPVKVAYTLPSYLLIYKNDTPRIALFDKNTGTWVSENIEEIKYDHETKQISFNTLRLAPFAYAQDRCTDYPFHSFQLRCIKPDLARLDIKAKRDTYKFEIGPGYVILLKGEEEHPELNHLIGNKLPVGQILYQLRKCGIHLMPDKQDAAAAGICDKDDGAEELAIKDICSAVRSFFIQSSKWSSHLSSQQILVQIRENMDYDDFFHEVGTEKEWKSICWWPNKVTCINSKEGSQTLDSSMVENSVAHGTLELLLKSFDSINKDCLERMKELDYIIFMDTLHRFMKLTKILTFTAINQTVQKIVE